MIFAVFHTLSGRVVVLNTKVGLSKAFEVRLATKSTEYFRFCLDNRGSSKPKKVTSGMSQDSIQYKESD